MYSAATSVLRLGGGGIAACAAGVKAASGAKGAKNDLQPTELSQ